MGVGVSALLGLEMALSFSGFGWCVQLVGA